MELLNASNERQRRASLQTGNPGILMDDVARPWKGRPKQVDTAAPRSRGGSSEPGPGEEGGSAEAGAADVAAKKEKQED